MQEEYHYVDTELPYRIVVQPLLWSSLSDVYIWL